MFQVLTRAWILLIAEMSTTPCPDCLLGLLIPWIAALLSAYMMHFVYDGLASAISVASLNVVASALYTLCSSSGPRYRRHICKVFGQAAAAPTYSSVPELSV